MAYKKMGMKSSYGKGFNLKDNTQASPVKSINVNSEKYDMGRCRKYSNGSQGYPAQASQENKMKGMY